LNQSEAIFRAVLIDENAFGVLISYFAVEDDEYGLEREEFAARFEAFRANIRAYLSEFPLGQGAFALDLGHAFYAEVAEGDQGLNPLTWVKKLRAELLEEEFQTVAVVTHGSRWVDPQGNTTTQSTEHLGEFALVTASNPSEPLRRALYADTASRPQDQGEQGNDDHEHDGHDGHDSDEGQEPSGWGPGVYLDTEAAEALSMTPKNAPTILWSGGAGFYRAGR
jgi:hypothetical protein